MAEGRDELAPFSVVWGPRPDLTGLSDSGSIRVVLRYGKHECSVVDAENLSGLPRLPLDTCNRILDSCLNVWYPIYASRTYGCVEVKGRS